MNDRPWFPAKRYGWGWGLPVRWQGWVVLGLYLAALAGGAFAWDSPRSAPWFVAYAFGLSAVLVFVCWRKGERPRWRWGK